MSAAPAATPRDALEQKKADLKKAETDAKEASDKVAKLRSEVTDLTRSVAQIDQALAGYDKTLGKLQAQRDDLDVQIAGFDATLQTLVREKRADIDAAIKKYDDDAAAAATHVDDLRGAWEKARDAADAAQQKAAAADKHLNDVKQSLKTADAAITELTALKGQIQQAMTDRNYAGAYFLLTEAEKITVNLPDRAAEEADLVQASTDADTAAAAAAKAQDDAKKARDAWQNAIPAADKARTGRRAAIVDALKAIAIAPPKPSSSAGSATTPATGATPPSVTPPPRSSGGGTTSSAPATGRS